VDVPAYTDPTRALLEDPRRALVGVDLGRARLISAAVALRVPGERFAGQVGPEAEAEMRKWAGGSTHKCITHRRLIHASTAALHRAWENSRGVGDYKAARDALAASGGTGMSVTQLHAFLAVSRAHSAALSDELLDGEGAIQRAKWGLVLHRAKLAEWDRFGRELLERRVPSVGRAAAGGLSHKLVRVDVLLGDVDFASSGRGEDAVPTKSIWRKLARVAATHYLPVRFLAPESEYCTTKCCCACGAVTTPATTPLRRCVSAQCTAPREARAGAAAGGDGRGGGEEDGHSRKRRTVSALAAPTGARCCPPPKKRRRQPSAPRPQRLPQHAHDPRSQAGRAPTPLSAHAAQDRAAMLGPLSVPHPGIAPHRPERPPFLFRKIVHRRLKKCTGV